MRKLKSGQNQRLSLRPWLTWNRMRQAHPFFWKPLPNQ